MFRLLRTRFFLVKEDRGIMIIQWFSSRVTLHAGDTKSGAVASWFVAGK